MPISAAARWPGRSACMRRHGMPAASQACTAWSGSSSGAFQKAAKPSAVSRSMVPPCASAWSSSGDSDFVHQTGEGFGIVAIVRRQHGQAAHAANQIGHGRVVSPSSRSNSGCRTIFSMVAGGRESEKAAAQPGAQAGASCACRATAPAQEHQRQSQSRAWRHRSANDGVTNKVQDDFKSGGQGESGEQAGPIKPQPPHQQKNDDARRGQQQPSVSAGSAAAGRTRQRRLGRILPTARNSRAAQGDLDAGRVPATAPRPPDASTSTGGARMLSVLASVMRRRPRFAAWREPKPGSRRALKAVRKRNLVGDAQRHLGQQHLGAFFPQRPVGDGLQPVRRWRRRRAGRRCGHWWR